MSASPSSLLGHAARHALCVAAACAALPVLAQTSGGTDPGTWWQPGPGRTTVGLNIGRSTSQQDCIAGYPCDDKGTYFNLYGRNMAHDTWGSQLGLVHLGRMERGGGTTRAWGLDLSLVGRTPLGSQGLGVFGKVGALLGHTRVSADPASGLPTGNRNGVGLSIGAGLSWDFSPKMSAVLEWDRYDLRFPGAGRDAIHATSIGLQYRY